METKKITRLLIAFILLFSAIFIMLSYKLVRDIKSQISAKEDRAELIELNKRQLEILENK